MKIAIPVFNTRISPVFDWCKELIIIDDIYAQVKDMQTVAIANLSALERIDYLYVNGIKLLVCGAISQQLFTVAKTKGIRVISGISGQVKEIVTAVSSGKLDQNHFAMPGCKRARRGRGHGQGRHGHGGNRRR